MSLTCKIVYASTLYPYACCFACLQCLASPWLDYLLSGKAVPIDFGVSQRPGTVKTIIILLGKRFGPVSEKFTNTRKFGSQPNYRGW